MNRESVNLIRRYSMKSGFVSIAIYVPSAGKRSRIAWVKVPTPGPYSTNNLTLGQSGTLSIALICAFDEAMIEPTITGRLKNPLRNIAQGEGSLRARVSALSRAKRGWDMIFLVAVRQIVRDRKPLSQSCNARSSL